MASGDRSCEIGDIVIRRREANPSSTISVPKAPGAVHGSFVSFIEASDGLREVTSTGTVTLWFADDGISGTTTLLQLQTKLVVKLKETQTKFSLSSVTT